jgi:hypothetical protein
MPSRARRGSPGTFGVDPERRQLAGRSAGCQPAMLRRVSPAGKMPADRPAGSPRSASKTAHDVDLVPMYGATSGLQPIGVELGGQTGVWPAGPANITPPSAVEVAIRHSREPAGEPLADRPAGSRRSANSFILMGNSVAEGRGYCERLTALGGFTTLRHHSRA